MGYREVRAPERLRGMIECGWVSDASATAVRQDVLPDGCMDLVWTGTELLVAGPDTAPHPYLREPGRAAAGLRFAPGILPALLAVPGHALRDRRVSLDELHPKPARAAVARLECGGSPLASLADLAQTLPGTFPEPGIRAVVRHLDSGATAAAARAGYADQPHLAREVRALAGVAPGHLQRGLVRAE